MLFFETFNYFITLLYISNINRNESISLRLSQHIADVILVKWIKI